MRALRILLLVVFLITSVVFGFVQVRSYMDKDDTAPEFHSDSDTLVLSVKDDDEKLLQGLAAVDDRDGNVTDSIVVAGKSNFLTDGVMRVDYAAFDSHNNVGTYSRRVTYEDYRSPRFSASGPLVLRSGSTYDFSFFQAEDVLSGDISEKIKILTSSTASSTGEYPIELEVTNHYGDVEKLELNLRVYNSAEYNRMYPALSQYIVYVPVGAEVDLASYLTGIWQGGKVLTFEETETDPAEIEIDDALLNTEVPGMYTVLYSLPVSRNLITETELIVIVTEDN